MINLTQKPARNTSLRQDEARPVDPLFLCLGAVTALFWLFVAISSFWNAEQYEKRAQAADQAYTTSVVDETRARELADMVQMTPSQKIKDALKFAFADDRLTNGEASAIEKLIESERREAEQMAALQRLKQAAIDRPAPTR